jgi:hypothetical protein
MCIKINVYYIIPQNKARVNSIYTYILADYAIIWSYFGYYPKIVVLHRRLILLELEKLLSRITPLYLNWISSLIEYYEWENIRKAQRVLWREHMLYFQGFIHIFVCVKFCNANSTISNIFKTLIFSSTPFLNFFCIRRI